MKRDDAVVVDYLSNLAGSLLKEGEFSQKDIESFRINLTALRLNPIDTKSSVVQALLLQHDIVLQALVVRYGAGTFWTNLFSYTIRSYARSIAGSLNQIGQSLSEKSNLFLNRPLSGFMGESSERVDLHACYLLDVADIACSSAQVLNGFKNLDQHRYLLGERLGLTDSEIEQEFKVAEALGFKNSSQSALFSSLIQRQLQVLSGILFDFTNAMHEYLTQLQFNFSSADAARLKIYIEQLRPKLTVWTNPDIPKTADLSILESFRSRFCSDMDTTLVSLQEISSTVLAIIATSPSLNLTISQKFPEALIRTLAYALIRHDVSPIVAVKAAGDLVRYAQTHAITPDKILAAELPKINPHLQLFVLEKFVEINSKLATAGFAARSKHEATTRSQKLASLAANLSGSLVVFLAILFFAGACGVKTGPKSELNDVRPAVSFKDSETEMHIEQNQPEDESNKKQVPKMKE